VSDAGEVDGASGVEGFLRAPGPEPGEQDGVFVAFAGGGVDGEAEGVGGAVVAQPEQRELLAAGQDPGDVDEAAAVQRRLPACSATESRYAPLCLNFTLRHFGRQP
jgi:hypothetical protein